MKPDRPARTILIRGDKRLDVRIALDAPMLFTLGLVDASAKPAPRPDALRDDLSGWISAMTEELERLSR